LLRAFGHQKDQSETIGHFILAIFDRDTSHAKPPKISNTQI
jgi:hypothetical protein